VTRAGKLDPGLRRDDGMKIRRCRRRRDPQSLISMLDFYLKSIAV
jgi:hypothetical protein